MTSTLSTASATGSSRRPTTSKYQCRWRRQDQQFGWLQSCGSTGVSFVENLTLTGSTNDQRHGKLAAQRANGNSAQQQAQRWRRQRHPQRRRRRRHHARRLGQRHLLRRQPRRQGLRDDHERAARPMRVAPTRSTARSRFSLAAYTGVSFVENLTLTGTCRDQRHGQYTGQHPYRQQRGQRAEGG